MAVAEGLIRRLVRLLVVLACATGASWGFASGAHAATHSLAGAATPSHHHSLGGHAPQSMDEGTQIRTSRRVNAAAICRVLDPVVAAWVGLRSWARGLTPPALAPQLWIESRLLRASPERLCIHRT